VIGCGDRYVFPTCPMVVYGGTVGSWSPTCPVVGCGGRYSAGSYGPSFPSPPHQHKIHIIRTILKDYVTRLFVFCFLVFRQTIMPSPNTVDMPRTNFEFCQILFIIVNDSRVNPRSGNIFESLGEETLLTRITFRSIAKVTHNLFL
jgi:hypothetical protein